MIGYRPDAGVRALLCGKGGSTPPAPDYTAAAEKQSAASKEIATQQTWANRPNQNTPWGSTFWTSEGQIDPATGQAVTSWTQNQSLDPKLQGALDDQLAIQSGRSQLAGGFMGRVAEEYSQPFDWESLPGMAGTPQQQFTYGRDADVGGVRQITQAQGAPALVDERHRIEQGLFDRMRPEHDRQTAQTQTQLANQGLTPGSEAYNLELQRISDQQSRDRYGALEMGGQEQQRLQGMQLGREQQAFSQRTGQQDAYNRAQAQLFSQDMGANAQNYQQMMGGAEYQNKLRQQAIAEQAQARGMSLNEMNALLTGQQVSSPQMPGFQSASAGQAPQYNQAAQNQYGASMDQFNADQASAQSMQSGLFSLGGAALGAFAL